MKKYLLLLAIILMARQSPGQASVDSLEQTLLESGFVVSEQSDARNGPLYQAVDYSDRVQILELECRTERQPVKFNGRKIKYIGSNHGGFGGDLKAEFTDGKIRTLLERQIVSIVQSRDNSKLFVFTGLTHLGLSSGNVYTVERYDTDPKLKPVTLLPDAPIAAFADIGRPHADFIYILGYRSLMYLGGEDFLSIEVLNAWNIFGPVTVFQKDSEILVGQCGTILYIKIREIGGLIPAIVKFYSRPLSSNNSLEKDAPKSENPSP